MILFCVRDPYILRYTFRVILFRQVESFLLRSLPVLSLSKGVPARDGIYRFNGTRAFPRFKFYPAVRPFNGRAAYPAVKNIASMVAMPYPESSLPLRSKSVTPEA